MRHETRGLRPKSRVFSIFDLPGRNGSLRRYTTDITVPLVYSAGKNVLRSFDRSTLLAGPGRSGVSFRSRNELFPEETEELRGEISKAYAAILSTVRYTRARCTREQAQPAR